MYNPQGKRVGKILFDVDKLYDTVYHWAERSTGPLRGAYRDVLNQIDYLKNEAIRENVKESGNENQTDKKAIEDAEIGSRSIRIESINGKTLVELGGKTLGKGVTAVSFEHDCDNGIAPVLKLTIDCKRFRFEPDGYFDKAITHRSHER